MGLFDSLQKKRKIKEMLVIYMAISTWVESVKNVQMDVFYIFRM